MKGQETAQEYANKIKAADEIAEKVITHQAIRDMARPIRLEDRQELVYEIVDKNEPDG